MAEQQITVTCDSCGKTHNIPEVKVPEGKTITGKCTCGHKITISNPPAQPVSTKECPKCGAEVPANDESCPGCGVIFSKYDEVTKRKEQSFAPVVENLPETAGGKKRIANLLLLTLGVKSLSLTF